MIAFEQHKFIGITGIIGSGKSFFVNSILKKYDPNIIEVDDIRRNLLWYSLSDLALNLRKTLINAFLITHYDENFFFDRTTFTHYIFSHASILARFNRICFPYFKKEIESLFIPDKLNLLVWVNLIEDNYYVLVDHIVLVVVTEKTWLERHSHTSDMKLIEERLKIHNTSNIKQQLLHTIAISHEVFINE